MKNVHIIITVFAFFFVYSIFAQQGVDIEKERAEIATLFSGSVIHKPTKGKGNTNNQNFKTGNCGFQEVNRRIDGCCNNILTNNTNLGSAGQALRRIIPDVYNANSDLVGQNRKSPREISEIVVQMNGEAPSATLSSFVFTWGQFLDHDITATPTGNEDASIPDITGDVIVGPIPFNRSLPMTGTGVNGIPREQFNEITSWVDASNVYGSDVAHANDLRTFVDGKLKVSTATNGEDILPMINGNFTAGDERALEQPGLTSLHILFVREHNRICHELKNCGMTDDESIYQKARKQVGALMQTITYQEFLPALGVQLPAYNGYNSGVQPNISNIFATAGFRLGHTMVTDNVVQFDDNGNQTNSLSLAQAFFNPSLTQTNGIEGFLNGLANQFQEEVDARIVESLRSFLFAPTPTGPGLDLAALNIQRGRDHGLDDYNAFRTAFGIGQATSFNQITSNTTLQNQLINAFNNNINDIDVWVGLLSEDHLPGTSLGPTLHAIMEEQFAALRDGDFYFFENDPALTATEKHIIRNTRLSDIIKRNTDIQNIKADVFFGPCNNSYSPAACIPDSGDCGCEVWEVCKNGNCILNYDPNACQCNVALQVYNNGNCSVNLFHWLPTGDVFIATISPGNYFTVYTNEGEKWRAANNSVGFNDSYTVVGCQNQIFNTDCHDGNCIPDIAFTTPIAGFLDQEVSNWIEGKTNNIIHPGANVTYDAGNKVHLKPGFKALWGSNFHAFIDGCGGCAKTDHTINQNLRLNENGFDEMDFELNIYPNPANQTASITYQLQKDEQVSIYIFDATGKQMKELIKNQIQQAGLHQLELDASNLPTGLYYLKLQSSKKVATKKLMIAK